jgi:hypothetical protein
LVVTAGGVAAYGQADAPLAQIEWSANCNNPTFPLCAPTDQGGVGIGGIWLWIEIDGGAGATSGTADVAGSACGHDRAGSGGAGSIRGEFPWWWSATPVGDNPLTGLGYPTDPNGYYIVAIGPQVITFPVSQGHYGGHPVPGVSVNIQVAP